MYDAVAVCVVQRACDALRHLDRFLNLQAPLLFHELMQVFPFQKLHRDEVDPLLVPLVVYCDDVRVTELRNGTRLEMESFHVSGIVDEAGEKDFESDLSLQVLLYRLVHRGVPPVSDLCDDFVFFRKSVLDLFKMVEHGDLRPHGNGLPAIAAIESFECNHLAAVFTALCLHCLSIFPDPSRN